MEESSVIQEFILETTHVLQTVEQDLLSLERASDVGTLSRVFRSLHSIKGSSSFLELAAIEKLSHHAETLLDLLRKDKRKLTPPMNDALLKCVDQLREMLQQPDFGQTINLDATLASLESFIKGEPPAPPPPKPAPVLDAPVTGSTVHTRIQSILPSIPASILPETIPPIPSPPPTPPLVAASPPPSINVSVSVPVKSGEASANSSPRIEVMVNPPVNMTASLPPKSVTSAAKPAPEPEPAEEDKMMRVRVKFLDDLLQLTGNMVMARNQLLAKYNFADDPAFITLSQCVTEVHKTIVQTRMNPIGSLFDRCERLVRDLSRQLAKEVKLEITGRELELDRSVLESFADPLMHLLRNGMDHGLEATADRQAVGKPRTGLLKLGAREQSGEVILSLADDGRGIDLDAVKDKAVAKGLIPASRAAMLNRRGIMDLLFMPGFSTRDDVTSLSGRGVGLDVVRTNIEQLGGIVEVDSNLGQGTTFTARIPLTQALVSSSLISAIIVKSGEQRYAIPQTAVDEIIRVNPEGDRDRIHRISGQSVYQLRDQVLPVVSLTEVLGLPVQEEGDGARILIVMQFRGQLFGLQVEGILGVEEIVVRPLPELVRHCKIFTGHTVMGDGRVALILDGNGIISHRKLVFADEFHNRHNGHAAERSDGPQRLVVFSFADDEFFAIPLEMVSYIEKISTAAIKKVGAREFIQVNQRTMPILRIDKVMSVSAMTPHKEAYLIIPARVNYPIAVLAGRSVSVVDVAEHYESRLSDGRGMLGTFMHQDRLVMLLDLYHLFERHSPDQFRSSPLETRPAHILVAEDSPFFQNLIRSYLENPPRRLTIVANGRLALELLQASPEEFDILVSDIEMPEMDGFELVKKVRLDARLRTLPVIAVTSLATTEHIERGLREGFDSYLIKIDKEQLVKTIERNIERGMQHRAVTKALANRAEG
ncbi:hybrid sensor histidine kinase/response regulator [Zavarzinella formosa]|uniref:hybrid sensor histidine kinase/response regulator n=1 Tax=Zavarzinella formosa TaxID=360055 RepID=UPI0002EF20EA|nr:hybrid sensor histidine kinase/response regulator [Zavarzinella formosa]